MGIYLSSSSNNNTISGGSIISNSGSSYYIEEGSKNTFTHTNITTRTIVIAIIDTAWFNYSNRTGLPYVANNLSDPKTISRTLYNWTQTNITFSESVTTTTATSYYNITGLMPLTRHDIWIDASLLKTEITSASGQLINFPVGLTTTPQTIKILANIYPLNATAPPNNSVSVSTPVMFNWTESPIYAPYTLYISTDNQFINIVSTSTIASGTSENFTTTISGLQNGTTYWWKVKNNSGYYTKVMNFTTSATSITPGRLNISVYDEQTWKPISNFSIQIYNATFTTMKNTTSYWVNFSSAEVAAGQYLVRVVPNSSYASRSILVTSPGNGTLYVPSTAAPNTIDTVAFYLFDYTNQFPWTTSILTVTKNNSIMHQSYFDADAKVAVYLIDGDSYGLSVANGNNIYQWGNYIAVGSGNVQVTLTDISVNASKYAPLSFNITHTQSDIVLNWRTASNTYLSSLNFTIIKGQNQVVHQLITSIIYGQSTYIVTNTSDIYYVYFSALTSDGWFNQSFALDYRVGAINPNSGNKTSTSYLNFTLPDWIKTLLVLIVIIATLGTFGSQFAPLGGIIAMFTLIEASRYGWISNTVGASTFFAGLAVIIIADYIKGRDQEGEHTMIAYKLSVFMIFANAGIILVNASGLLLNGGQVSTYGFTVIFNDILSKYGLFTLVVISFGVLALSTFGLFALSLPPMAILLGASTLIGNWYIGNMNLGLEWTATLIIGVTIVNIVGYLQYSGMASLKQKE